MTDQRTRIALWVIRGLFFLSAVGLGLYLAKALGRPENEQYTIMVIAGALAAPLVVAEVFFTKTDIRVVSSIVFGLIIGFIMAQLFVGVITVVGGFSVTEDIEAIESVRVILITIFCYLGVTFLLQSKDEFRFIIPYVEFKRETRGSRPLVLDTSALIDGRFADVAETRLFENKIIVPSFVIDELQAIADSQDKGRRARGRRGFDVVARLRHMNGVDVEIGLANTIAPGGVDQKLVALAAEMDARIVTNDFNLSKVAGLQGVDTVNLNDLADALKPALLPGEKMRVKVVREGESAEQGVGYLDDGTMVVIEKGKSKIGEEVSCFVTGSYQTNAGRMIFGRLGD